MPRPADEPRAALRWLVALRWFSLAGQATTIGVVAWVTALPLELTWLSALVIAGAMSNFALGLTREPTASLSRRLIATALLVDVGLLTALLLVSGGPSNPFSIFYLVHVVLAGLLLGAPGAFAMAGISSLSFGLLFFLPSVPIDEHAMHHHGAASLHLQGMWVAFALAAVFVASFVAALARALGRRDRELERLTRRAERSERLAALATFSASAAHELGSPLGTIAVSARELERALEQRDGEAGIGAWLEDVRLIRAEVERCRGLLTDLTRRGGLLGGEHMERVSARELWREVAARVGEGRPKMADPEGPEVWLEVPRIALTQALLNLVDNAQRAQQQVSDVARRDRPIEVGTRLERDIEGREVVRLWVRDKGEGFAEAVLGELGEAFVTTRPQDGLGLGLHLGRELAHTLGGRLDVLSSPDGSEVAIALPLLPVGPPNGGTG